LMMLLLLWLDDWLIDWLVRLDDFLLLCFT
jgi:hypothetical protein